MELDPTTVGVTEEMNGQSSDGIASSVPEDQVTFFVGPKRVKLVASVTHLSDSPVFARMIGGNFKEAVTKVVELPEDQPEHIEIMLDYLDFGGKTGYALGLRKSLRTQELTIDTWAQKVTELYMLGDRYILPDFQAAVVKEFKAMKLSQWPSLFFELYQ
ncbi:hypothetical protein MMC25_007662 [Agyrium rufum]|nr:hypothetical protein [Agyrium rufum]